MLTVGELFDTLQIDKPMIGAKARALDVTKISKLTRAQLFPLGLGDRDEFWLWNVMEAVDGSSPGTLPLPSPEQLLRWARCGAGTEAIERDDLAGPSALARSCHGEPVKLSKRHARELFATTSDAEHERALTEILEMLLARHARLEQIDSICALLDLWNEPLRVPLIAAALLRIGNPDHEGADEELARAIEALCAHALARDSRRERFEISAEGLARFLDRGAEHPRSLSALRHARMSVLRRIREAHPHSTWQLSRTARVANELALEHGRNGEHKAALAVFEEMRGVVDAFVAAEPDELEHQLGRAAVLKGIGSAKEAIGDLVAARECAAEDLELSEGLVKPSKRSPAMLLGAAVACRNAQRLSEDPAKAEALRRRGLKWLRPLMKEARRHPPVPQLWKLLGGE